MEVKLDIIRGSCVEDRSCIFFSSIFVRIYAREAERKVTKMFSLSPIYLVCSPSL